MARCRNTGEDAREKAPFLEQREHLAADDLMMPMRLLGHVQLSVHNLIAFAIVRHCVKVG